MLEKQAVAYLLHAKSNNRLDSFMVKTDKICFVHLYITVSDHVLPNDWCIVDNVDKPLKCLNYLNDGSIKMDDRIGYNRDFVHKIASTTDTSLENINYKYNMNTQTYPQPSIDFIQSFIIKHYMGKINEDLFIQYKMRKPNLCMRGYTKIKFKQCVTNNNYKS